MHPSDITKRKHVPSEEKFFNACKDQLSNKYHVFFSVRKGIYIDDNDTWFLEDFDEDRKLRCSPYKQAEESMRFFKRYYEDELETAYPGIYGNAVAFPNFSVSAPITVESPLALTIDREDMGNLQVRIVEIFRYFNTRSGGRVSFMAPDAQKKFISLINKRIALSIAAGALIEDKERELAEINQIQDVVIDLLSHYPKAFIIGGAGTGKTWIGIKKIKRCIAHGKKPLYLCYNSTLAARVKAIVDSIEADIYSIEELAYSILGEESYNAPVVNGCHEYADLFGRHETLQQYDLIVVDEAQDFTEDWAYCVNLLVKDDGSLYVFYDESQNVFSRNFGDKFFIDGKPFVLRYNIRNTSNIYQYTIDRTLLGTDTLVNQIEGVEPDVRKITRKQAVISFLDSVVNKLVNKEGVSPEKIVILSNLKLDQSVLKDVNYVGGYPLTSLKDLTPKAILFSPVEEFKGLEADIVIFINHTFKNEANDADIRAIQYTALTRARFYLYVIDYERKI